MLRLLTLFATVLLVSCRNEIESGDNLTDQDRLFIQSLGLLDSDEHVYQFYSEYKRGVAGNFYTDRRLASYWIDQTDSSNNKADFAFYKDVAALDTVYYAGLTFAPFISVTRKDSTRFKVVVDGPRADVQSFFEEALRLWQQNR